MADDAARSRLGRGLAALIGDVGDEARAVERARSQRRVPIEFLQPNPRNPRRVFSDAELDELAQSIARARHHPADRRAHGAGRRGQLRDHRRRAALARGAARGPARRADRRARRERRRSARACDHRERAARRSQSAGRGDRLSGARGRIQSFARTTSPRSSARAAAMSPTRCGCCKLPDDGEGLHQRRQALGRACARADRQPIRKALRARSSSAGLNVRQVEALAQERAEAAGRPSKARARVVKDADTVALEKAIVATRLALP